MNKTPSIYTTIDKFCDILEKYPKINKQRKDLEDKITDYVKNNNYVIRNGYKYYLRRKYIMNIVDINKLKTKYKSIYEDCLRQITIKEKLIRRKDNV